MTEPQDQPQQPPRSERSWVWRYPLRPLAAFLDWLTRVLTTGGTGQ